jgi:magnesium-transporting ATPase (P-type)
MKPYQIESSTVLETLAANAEHGLSSQEVSRRQRKDGHNILTTAKPRTIFSIFISQFQEPLVYILFFAALIIFVFGEDKLDAFIISGVLFFNAILGTVQETRTKNIIENLKKYVKTESVVLRDGAKTVVDDKELVVGDIIFLQEGQRVPADARLLETNNLRINESVLTGEAHTAEKNTAAIQQDVPLGDRTNMVFKGTYVLMGSGMAVVTAIGKNTEIGKIQILTEEIDTDIPLRKELERLSHWILLFIIVTCLLLFIIGIATGKPIKELLVMLTALFICVVPEGLPVVLTLVLVSGALQMAKHFVLVRNMQAVEALGRTDVIVIDKTGTLTRNEMMVCNLWTPEGSWSVSGQGYRSEGLLSPAEHSSHTDQKKLIEMALATTLLNNAEIIHIDKLDIFDIKGDPTEAALAVFAQKLGAQVTKEAAHYAKVHEIPFNSALRYHAGFYTKDDECIAFIIGSPEAVARRSTHQQASAEAALNEFLKKGLRVVAIGVKRLPMHACEHLTDPGSYETFLDTGVELLGFAGIEDSLRTEVSKTITDARSAGLSIIMATGDHQVTALHVAQQVGIFRSGDDYIDGSEIDKISDEQLLQRIDHITVFSRVSAEHKMRIVQLLQRSGKIVAMTGDGINDAPSLVAADLGIAMGSSGTEIAKQAADLVLLNDSFVTIVEAIEQGRHIFYTLKRIVLYFFSTNMGEVLIVLFALVAGLFSSELPLPITAVQILWLNLVTDGFLDVGLSMEPKEPDLLHNAWLKKKPQLIDTPLLLKMFFMALPMGIGSLAVFLAYYKTDLAHARTMALITMAMYQWFNAWNCRSETRSLTEMGLFSNRWLIAIMALVLFLQSAIVYVPFMRYIFKTVPLSLHDWIVIILVTCPIVVMEEIRKAVAQRWYVQ